MAGPAIQLPGVAASARGASGTTIEVIDARLAVIGDDPRHADERALLVAERAKLVDRREE